MSFRRVPLSAGLYFVSTPIGAARDITLRALDVLASADLIAAEDTRSARRLMEIHGVPLGGRRLVAYHDHSGAGPRRDLARMVSEGASVAYVSEAGTPLVSDPGYALGRAVVEAGGGVTACPGASAALAALTVSGLASDRFFFAGFLPPAKAARRSALAELRETPATLIFYESPRRVREMLDDLCEVFGDEREAALCRELTKKFEEVLRGSLSELRDIATERSFKGEIVLLVARADGTPDDADDMEDALRAALKTMRVKDAADAVAGALGRPRREVYQAALALAKDTR